MRMLVSRRLLIKKQLHRAPQAKENISGKLEAADNTGTVCLGLSPWKEEWDGNLFQKLSEVQFLKNLSRLLKKVLLKKKIPEFWPDSLLLISKLQFMIALSMMLIHRKLLLKLPAPWDYQM